MGSPTLLETFMSRLILFSICMIVIVAGASYAVVPSGVSGVPIANHDFSNDTESWVLQSDNEKDSHFAIDNNALRISRQQSVYFMRAYQDVAVSPNTAYEMTFRMKAEGEGSGMGWIYIHTTEGEWLEDAICFSPAVRAGDWQTVKVRVPASAVMDKLRLDFAPQGANTTIWVDDVSLRAIPAAPSELPLAPSLDMRPRLDGKLDEGFWRFALKLDDFRVLGQPDQPADPQAQVMLAVHNDMLYIAYRMDEPNPAGIRTEVDKPNDIAIHGDDCAETFISLDRKNVTQLDVSALGRYAIGGKEPIGVLPRNWHEHQPATETLRFKAAAARTDTGWTVEMQAPLVPLIGTNVVQKDAQGRLVLYANFCRHRPQDTQTPHSNWGRLTGSTFFAPDQYKPLALDWRVDLSDAQKSQPKTSRGDFTWRAEMPEHLIVGDPVIAEWNDAKTSLPAQVNWDTGDLTVAPVAREVIEPGIVCGNGERAWTIRCRLWNDGKLPRDVSAEQARRLSGDEAFMLTIGDTGAEVSGRTPAAVMRGLATLTMLCDNAKSQGKTQISTGAMLDAPALSIRGWLLSSRTPEELIRQAKVLFLLRYNTVMFDVTGYGDYAKFPFDSHPNIGGKTSTKEQWAQAADAIRALGMEPLPMAMLWSRCGFIANKPEYKHLAVRPDLEVGTHAKNSHDKNLSAALEESYQLVFDLLDELVDTMKVDSIHLALDEVFYDDLVTDEASKKLGLTNADWLIRVVNRTHNHLAQRGVRTWLWADCLDPGQNGRHFELSGPQMLEKLPQDLILHDWKYNAAGPFTSIKMFKDAGFTTVSGSWWRISNVSSLIGETWRYGADGFIGTSWGSSDPSSISAELTTAMSLGAYLSWSPQYCDHMDQFRIAPAICYQTAAFRHGLDGAAAKSSYPVEISPALISGEALCDALGLPGTTLPDAMSQPMTGPLGCRFQPFIKDGQAAAALVQGGRSDKVTIPLEGTAWAIAILHAVNRQAFNGSMHEMGKEYKTTVPVRYVLEYADGSTVELPVAFRRQINAWDDCYAAVEAWPVLFGTVGDTYQFNVPAMLWANPHPDRPLKSLQMISGNRPGMNAAVFAATLIR